MELLSVATARSVWLFDLNELNPRGKSLFPELFEWLKDEYHFEKAPKSTADVDETKAFVFSQGNFQVKEEIFVAVELKVYNDGLVANTWSSTQETDAFLEDVLRSAATEFSLAYKPEIIRRKMYFSELNVRSLRNLAGINPTLVQLANKVAELVPGCLGISFEFAGAMVSPIQSMTPAIVSPFRFERKNNTSPEEHKYYSTAPLHTDDHLRVLDWFEQNLMA